MLLPTFTIIYIIACFSLVIWAIKYDAKIEKEYGRCWMLERMYQKKIPFKFKLLTRKNICILVYNLCYNLNMPQIEYLKLRPFAARGFGVAGHYSVNALAESTLSVNGLFFYSMSTILHEIAHHCEAVKHWNFKHDERFLKSEEEVFETFLKIYGDS